MAKKCEICSEEIEEECGKLNGTIIKTKDEKKKIQFIYVCSNCQKKDKWIEIAKIKGA